MKEINSLRNSITHRRRTTKKILNEFFDVQCTGLKHQSWVFPLGENRAGAYRNIASFAYGHLYKKLASVQEKILKKYSLFLIN